MTTDEYLEALRAAAAAGDAEAAAVLAKLEPRKPTPFSGFPAGL